MKGIFPLLVFIRTLFIIINELVVVAMINTADASEDGGFDIIKDFTSVVIICELDDMMCSTSYVQKYKELFEIKKDEFEIKFGERLTDHIIAST